jgi:acetoacetyl-CoA synthetase
MSKPIWEPRQERIDRANMSRFIRFVREQTGHEDIQQYAHLYEFSVRQPEKFWPLVWEFCGIRASGEFEPVLVDSENMLSARFYPGVRLNYAQNLLRYKDDRLAIMARNDTGQHRQYTYAELHAEVGRLAYALRQAGIEKGDRVAGLLPNIPEAVIAMLATASLGATWTACAPDRDVKEIAERIGGIAPRLLFCIDTWSRAGERFDGLTLLRDVLGQIPSVERAIVVSNDDGQPTIKGLEQAVNWVDFVGKDDHAIEFTVADFDLPLYVTYSERAANAEYVVHGAGGTLLQHLKDLVLHTDIKREDRILFQTQCDEMMWGWLVSSLAAGATLVLYDGSPSWPSRTSFWDLVDEVGVSILGTTAQWIDANRNEGIRPRETHKLFALKTVLSTGPSLSCENYDYVYGDIKDRLLLAAMSSDLDIATCLALGNPLLPVYRGEISCRSLGMKIETLDTEGKPVRGESGELACLAPFPSMPVGFWNDPTGERYRRAYFAGHPTAWSHGVFGRITEHDGVILDEPSRAIDPSEDQLLDAAEISG